LVIQVASRNEVPLLRSLLVATIGFRLGPIPLADVSEDVHPENGTENETLKLRAENSGVAEAR
jgi:hypothetical protein